MKQDKKRSRSSSSSSVSSDELNVSKDHDRSSVDSSSDSDVVEVEAKQSRKKKKHRHKHSEGDENDSSSVHEERNGKLHKHKCHHRHHHHHHHHHRHGHHKHHCRSKESDERNHTKHKAMRNSNDAEVVRIKQEPLDETDDSNSRMSQKSHSSRRQNERGQSSRTNGADRSRFEHHRETSNSSREREMERRRPRNEQSSETRNDDRDARRPKEERKRSGRKNRWEADDDAALNRNHPIKQEPESEGEFEWGKKANPSRDKKIPPGEKSKPNFGLSGKLTEDTNTFNGVVIKYSEPPEARKPKRRWRLYPFKGDQGLPTLYIHRQSSYLIGRDRKVADIPVDHPSCSKQHAALQYRLVPYEREDRTIGKRVRPYIIDLESSNGTFVNGVKIEARKYVEIMEKDVVKFGYSSREYVLLHEQSKDDELDDDVGANEEVPAE